jgi:hypothetical protein
LTFIKETLMRRYVLSILFFSLAVGFTASPLAAQLRKLDINLSHLESQASETVEITLEKEVLRLATRFLSGQAADERQIRDLVQGLTGIYVRSFEFKRNNAYSASDVERIRAQLGRPWERIVKVRSSTSDNVDIFIYPRTDDIVGGLVIIAAEPRELTVVQILGDIPLDRISSLDGQFGIPRMGLEQTRSKGKK